MQASPVVQALPSSQAMPINFTEGVLPGVCVQPSPTSHASTVHGLPSLQLSAVPLHADPTQPSLVVQAFPSLQLVPSVTFACVQPPVALQPSVVHAKPSSQLVLLPEVQVPFAHTSPEVQALPSLHSAVLAVCLQPSGSPQLSSVHTLPSSQEIKVPWHLPALHKSLAVQFCPSSQVPPFSAECLQPVTLEQESAVHASPSSQKPLDAVPTHLPLAHVSPLVQSMPSSQPAELGVNLQPTAGSQVSFVHTVPSSHTSALPLHAPFAQPSPVVQGLPSLHGVPSLLPTKVQPLAGLQPSVVQVSPSLHTLAVPLHAVPLQVSVTVHALPSSQVEALTSATCTQPLLPQLSLVQGLLSSHDTLVAPTHVPPVQTSPLVHAFPSLQMPLRLVCPQPPAGAQVSAVQILPSSQFTALPAAHLPLAHASPLVHALPSSQVTALAKCTQPMPSPQPSSVHRLPSLQLGATPTQLPFRHASLVLHAWPSSQTTPLAAW